MFKHEKQSIPGSHTGALILSKYKAMLDKWGIRHEQVHMFVVDNAANMRRAMLDGKIPYLGCFAHTLQLIINDGVLSQRCARYFRVFRVPSHS